MIYIKNPQIVFGGGCYIYLFIIIIFKDFIYSEREREREAETQAEGEAGSMQAPCREPDVGLDPGSPGSHPRLQAALNCCTTGAALNYCLKGT